MNIKKISLLVVFVSVVIALFLTGCKHDSINFYRESKAQMMSKQLSDKNSNKSTIKNSSGVIIYKDNSVQNNSDLRNTNFGPRDINFDMPVKFK